MEWYEKIVKFLRSYESIDFWLEFCFIGYVVVGDYYYNLKFLLFELIWFKFIMILNMVEGRIMYYGIVVIIWYFGLLFKMLW